MASTAAGATGSTYKSYATDLLGSVVGLERSDGSVSSDEAYEYDPYGELERKRDAPAEADAEAQLSVDARENPFRFQGFHYASGVKTYDMQARPYRPDVGRFLTADRYEAARADFNLQADPLTQSRFAFVGGNPTTNVEWDGHRLPHSDCNGSRRCLNAVTRANRRGNNQRLR